MKRNLIAAALLGSVLLPSCRIINQRVDLTWFKDVMTTPQSDAVVVEAGQGLPETAPAVQTPAGGTALAQTPTAAKPVAQAPAAAVQAPVAAQPVVKKGSKTYTVVKGDTLSKIAARNKCTAPALMAANGITDPRALKIGTVLTIPEAGSAAAQAPVLAAAQAPTPTAPVVTAPAAPKPTASVATPKKKSWQFWKQSAPKASNYYVVQPGDTLSGIARSHGTTLSALLAANGLTMAQANSLSVGQKIVLPASH